METYTADKLKEMFGPDRLFTIHSKPDDVNLMKASYDVPSPTPTPTNIIKNSNAEELDDAEWRPRRIPGLHFSKATPPFSFLTTETKTINDSG